LITVFLNKKNRDQKKQSGSLEKAITLYSNPFQFF